MKLNKYFYNTSDYSKTSFQKKKNCSFFWHYSEAMPLKFDQHCTLTRKWHFKMSLTNLERSPHESFWKESHHKNGTNSNMTHRQKHLKNFWRNSKHRQTSIRVQSIQLYLGFLLWQTTGPNPRRTRYNWGSGRLNRWNQGFHTTQISISAIDTEPPAHLFHQMSLVSHKPTGREEKVPQSEGRRPLKFQRTCFYWNKKGHWIAECRTQKRENSALSQQNKQHAWTKKGRCNQKLQCDNCRYARHHAGGCRRRKNTASAYRNIPYDKQKPKKLRVL